MEEYVKQKLNTKIFKKTGINTSGCISNGEAYETDNGIIFIKTNSKVGAGVMFNGEFEGLKAIAETNTVKVPTPLLQGEVSRTAFIVMDYLEIGRLDKYSAQLGENLAKLHLNNLKNKEIGSSVTAESSVFIDKFGFHTPTCCGFLPQNNDWCDDWVSFYLRKLKEHVDIAQKTKSDRELAELFCLLERKISNFFKDIVVYPSLVHGDLWSGNTGETSEESCIFDCSVFYGHHEFDLAIAGMFGGFNNKFYKSYHSLIPKEKGFEERHKLYQLFHYLNHWSHFGSSYRGTSISILKELTR